ncbi:MAG: glycine cleavage system protein GcvH [Proteobacteria bacterium]|nr:glycine cleavage system protein GcvH [Pseudomonadota bacterium]
MSSVNFSKEHEWIRVEGANAVVGITEFAQEQLGDVVFVELPEVGASVTKGGEAAVVESVKAASEIYAPASGEVTEVNQALADDPGRINADAMGEGWLFKIRLSDAAELEDLMDADAYGQYTESLS